MRARAERHAVRAYVRTCVAAREYFHTEVNNTPRYPGQGWPTTTVTTLYSPASPKISTLSSRRSRGRLLREARECLVFTARCAYARVLYVHARMYMHVCTVLYMRSDTIRHRRCNPLGGLTCLGEILGIERDNLPSLAASIAAY